MKRGFLFSFFFSIAALAKKKSASGGETTNDALAATEAFGSCRSGEKKNAAPTAIVKKTFLPAGRSRPVFFVDHGKTLEFLQTQRFVLTR